MPPRVDFASQRLFVDAALSEGAEIGLAKEQANYLLNVLRMRAGDGLLVFNGRDGEWRAAVADAGRKRRRSGSECAPAAARAVPHHAVLRAPQARAAGLHGQKAVEMGAGRLLAIDTERTQVEIRNEDRLRANIVEAAEQCGVLAVPTYLGAIRLDRLAQRLRDEAGHAVFCDEMAEISDPPCARAFRHSAGRSHFRADRTGGGLHARHERSMILGWPVVRAISLGPRILRADTAAVAALAAVQMAAGDWRTPLRD